MFDIQCLTAEGGNGLLLQPLDFFYNLKRKSNSKFCQKMDKCLQSKIIFIFLTFDVLSISSLYYLPFHPSSRLVLPKPGPHFQPLRHTRSSYSYKTLARMVKR